MNFSKKLIGNINGKEINIITFTNDNNYIISFYNFGGYINTVLIPYKNNSTKHEDVILGYNNLENCKLAPGFFNGIIGRVANRISDAKFKINTTEFSLFKNDGEHHLHGGKEGFNKKVWKINKIIKTSNELSCELKYLSKNLEEGYPGNLNCTAIYSLNNKNEFIIRYTAVSDEDTPVSITNHNYWNFHGHGDHYKNIVDHTVKIFSSNVCENNEQSIPTGKILLVENTKFDFTRGKIITQDFLNKGGVDNNYDFGSSNELKKVAVGYSNITRMGVTYLSDQPGNQFYTGNNMTNDYIGKYNRAYGLHHGFCFEPQFPPDGINQQKLQSPILKAGEKYNSTIMIRLSNDF